MLSQRADGKESETALGTGPQIYCAGTGRYRLYRARKRYRWPPKTGDRISFAVGSAPERIEWAIATATDHLEKIGRDRSKVMSIGAFINLVCDAEASNARSKWAG